MATESLLKPRTSSLLLNSFHFTRPEMLQCRTMCEVKMSTWLSSPSHRCCLQLSWVFICMFVFKELSYPSLFYNVWPLYVFCMEHNMDYALSTSLVLHKNKKISSSFRIFLPNRGEECTRTGRVKKQMKKDEEEEEGGRRRHEYPKLLQSRPN